MSGVVGAWTGSPFYLIKTRLQSAGGLVGAQHAYSGALFSLYMLLDRLLTVVAR